MNRAVFFLQNFNPKDSPMSLSFFDHLLWNEVMVDINRAVSHASFLFNDPSILSPDASKCSAFLQLDEISSVDHFLRLD